MEGGHLKTYFRGEMNWFDFLHNLDILNVDYGKDFKGDFVTEDG